MRVALFCVVLGFAACTSQSPEPADLLAERTLQPLPEPLSNNAVAVVTRGDREFIFSFLGLGTGKTWQDTKSSAWLLERGAQETDSGSWRRLDDVPGPGGRLAAVAVNARGSVYLFGGYTVAADHSEKSVPLVHRIDPDTLKYEQLPAMPVPVDDTVALVYQDRYIYLVSGWHDTDNIELVQMYDLETGTWRQASSFPGPPVFGHAGGLSGNTMIVCDGVEVVPLTAGKREFRASRECFKGEINPRAPEKISWTAIAHPPGPARYRMAAVAGAEGRIYFAGGSDNPYNYNGIGYNGEPSAPSATVMAYELATDRWMRLRDLPFPSMDHRGFLPLRDGFLLVGGMGENQQVLARTLLVGIE